MSNLKSENVILAPFSEPWHMEYLWSLIQKYRLNTISGKALFETAMAYAKHLWIGKTKDGLILGVIYLSHLPGNMWTLDAYRDDSMLRTVKEQRQWSQEAGELVCKYFFDLKICDSLYTSHRKENKLATKLCERLGFKKEKIFSYQGHDYQLLKKVR